ncbi:MAG: hypothetical protein KAX19_13360, partial [Candidatus Brocadiae bacterium]|nr:hypothetical protein [Candidatus Brocadiia bacterium]
MTNKADETHTAGRRHLAMLGIPDQRCDHGNSMIARTVMGSARVERLAGELFGKVCTLDLDGTAQLDRRVLGELQPRLLLERVKQAVEAHPDLRLSADFGAEALSGQAGTLKALAAGQKPQLSEELAQTTRRICREAGRGTQAYRCRP